MNNAPAMMDETKQDKDDLPKRQVEVLSAVLDLMVEEGDGFSMASVARRASCSKETLYKWYGDRNGLLDATVQWQAAKVVVPGVKSETFQFEDMRSILRSFAESWLSVISGDVSIALNRIAVAHAGNNKTNLGQIVLHQGPLKMKERLLNIFEISIGSGFISGDRQKMLRAFFGLVLADTQIRLLLGDEPELDRAAIREFSEEAVEQFLQIFGTENIDKHDTYKEI